MERALIVFKPDAVKRGLEEEILSRFVRTGLIVVTKKRMTVDKDLANKHYPLDRDEFIRGMGQKTLDNYQEFSLDPIEQIGTSDALEIGKIIQGWLVTEIMSGPVLAVVLEGPHVVEIVRKLCGHTLPLKAAPGTIRGDYALDSAYLANKEKRAIRNLVHASGTPEEAQFEINLWFPELV